MHFASTAQRGVYVSDLEALAVQTHTIKLNDNSFDAFAEALNPQIVVTIGL